VPARVAITGAAGQLGRELVAAFAADGAEVLALVRPEFELSRAPDLDRLAEWRPDVVINAAAWTDVDGCARDPERAMAINGHAAGAVAAAADRVGALTVQVSTNEVFDGQLDRAYTEDDTTNPISPYGASKLLGERLVAGASRRHLIVRTAWIFGRDSGFPTRIRAAADRVAAEGKPLRVVADEWGNPTAAEWLASAIVRVVALERAGGAPTGVYHAAGDPPTTRLAWAEALLAGHAVSIEPMALADYRRDSTVPPRAVLDTSRLAGLGVEPGDWRGAIPR
jgi:dTDP-4-dehydrorhamnose reductase